MSRVVDLGYQSARTARPRVPSQLRLTGTRLPKMGPGRISVPSVTEPIEPSQVYRHGPIPL